MRETDPIEQIRHRAYSQARDSDFPHLARAGEAHLRASEVGGLLPKLQGVIAARVWVVDARGRRGQQLGGG